jgi:DNA-binding XRE family transcriptional regulator
VNEKKTPEFAQADDVFAALESIPGINDDLAEREAAREQMEREHRVGLATIRQVAALTQTEVAEKMGVRQTSISRLEARGDVLLSTLKAYFDAVGADAVITIRIGNVEHRVSLDELV